jgi:K+-transporting ATPase A subunit
MRLIAAFSALAVPLFLAVPAFAGDNGEGLYGETDDKIITFFSLGVVVFFALLVTVLSIVQQLLEKRKEQRKAVELRRRVGW